MLFWEGGGGGDGKRLHTNNYQDMDTLAASTLCKCKQRSA